MLIAHPIYIVRVYNSRDEIFFDHLAQSESAIIQRNPVRVEHRSIGRQDADGLANSVGDRTKFGLTLPQHLLGALTVLDVCMERIPVSYLAFRISRWYGTHLEPAVNPIRAKKTRLNVKVLARFDRLGPRLDYAGKILRMNDTDAAPVFQLLICFAEILLFRAVEKLRRARS